MLAAEKTMKKITLSLLVGCETGAYSLTPSAVSFEFIYGIGPKGITPFEAVVASMEVDESRQANVSSDELESFFGSLFPSFRKAVGLHILPEKLCLNYELVACTEPSPREVVTFMAKTLGHGGCGGSCDCGCS